MTKKEFRKWIKALIQDMTDGYYGEVEFIDELWDNYNALQKALQKQLKKGAQK